MRLHTILISKYFKHTNLNMVLKILPYFYPKLLQGISRLRCEEIAVGSLDVRMHFLFYLRTFIRRFGKLAISDF